MKLYKREPEDIIRLQISRQGGEQTEYINLHQTTMDEVEKFCKRIITENLKPDPFVEGKKTMINIRECKGGKNGKAKNISFRGLNPKETKDLIIDCLTEIIK